MALTAFPFSQHTGELLPAYRDAYLRGDLTAEHTRMVDNYLQKNTARGTQTWQRYHEMAQTGEQVLAVGWMQRQIDRVRTSTGRTRRQAAALMAVTMLLVGAVFARHATPVAPGKVVASPSAVSTLGKTPATGTEALVMATISGRILDESGKPLVGATVFEKNTRRGVSTNAEGAYSLQVPYGRPTTLAYGYSGYTDEEVHIEEDSHAVENVTLLPTKSAPTKGALARWTRKAARWLFN